MINDQTTIFVSTGSHGSESAKTSSASSESPVKEPLAGISFLFSSNVFLQDFLHHEGHEEHKGKNVLFTFVLSRGAGFYLSFLIYFMLLRVLRALRGDKLLGIIQTQYQSPCPGEVNYKSDII